MTASTTIHDEDGSSITLAPYQGEGGGYALWHRGVMVWRSVGMWRPIREAKKDGTIIWAKLRDDIYPVLKPSRDDLVRWNGVQIPLRHYGLAEDGFDIGWGIAAPVGCGGFPDEWIAGFIPLPTPSTSEKTDD